MKAIAKCSKCGKSVESNDRERIKQNESLHDCKGEMKIVKVIENSGNYSMFCPEFSKGQFLKTSETINRIVHKWKVFPEDEKEMMEM